IPAIHDFNRKIGLDEQDFMRNTGATFKLGIEFVDWANIGDAYMHPFGRYGFDLNGVAFHHYWLHSQQLGSKIPYAEYCVPPVAAKRGRFALPLSDPGSVLSTYSYAFHFDASLYAAYLRRHSETRGVVRTEGRIVDVSLREGVSGNKDFVASVTLENHQVISGDLFIDCSGFRALLIGKALGVPYRDWQQWLPCDRAVAAPSANPEVLDPYTRATARSAGWQWRIPLQHRTGNGHVYCSNYLSDDEASAMLLANLECEALAEPRVLQFVAGRRENCWSGNCIAIGLSGGFLEPLESTSIFLIQAAIMKLIEHFPDSTFNAANTRIFNESINRMFEQIRDFIIFHYKATNRDDSAFWNYCRTMPVPETLDYRMRAFRERGHVVFSRRELFIETNWVAVFLGQGLVPDALDPRVACLPDGKITNVLDQIRQTVGLAVETLPGHAAFVDAYCAAAPEPATASEMLS
ncbi:MAG: tryptophan 7-halogenase, partial [Gammaproteobacteria bacterium]|nr:tryptophan 7-halogenase [Gammaproteobacteria bacterium]